MRPTTVRIASRTHSQRVEKGSWKAYLTFMQHALTMTRKTITQGNEIQGERRDSFRTSGQVVKGGIFGKLSG